MRRAGWSAGGARVWGAAGNRAPQFWGLKERGGEGGRLGLCPQLCPDPGGVEAAGSAGRGPATSGWGLGLASGLPAWGLVCVHRVRGCVS